MCAIKIRPSTENDIKQIMSMFDNSRQLMRASGNQNQWVNGYPSRELIYNDIHNNHSFIATDNGEIAGTFAFIIGRDPTYNHIDGEGWEDDSHPYGTIHRMAKAKDRHGIFEACINWCRTQTTSLRIDTHEDNTAMKHLIPKHGFTYRGIIHIADGTPRLAYQMLNTGILCEPLKEMIETTILPRYEAFDNAHKRDHAESVIRNSLKLAQHYDVDINMVYTIAAYHDLGLSEGRERHHIVSGDILKSDNSLRQWFSDNNLKMMAEAIEDHRASSKSEPRSIYGRIVAEADRDIEPEKILLRTVQYGLSNYPELSKEQHWQRFTSHLKEKYASGGYLHLWLPESPNAANLKELRSIIDDRQRLREYFERYFENEKRSSKYHIQD